MPDPPALTWADITTWNSLVFWDGSEEQQTQDPATVVGTVTTNLLFQSAKSGRRK